MSNDVDQITRKQHFVPQFYLKKFTNTNNKVEVLDCKQNKILSPRGTGGICYKDFFYGMMTGELDDVSQQIEKAFRQMEDWIAKNLETIISKVLNDEQILDHEKWLIAFLMSLLWLRNPEMRNQINRMQEQVVRKVNILHFSHPNIDKWLDSFDKKRGSVTSPEIRAGIKKMVFEGEYSLDFNNYHHLAMFDGFKGFANLFFAQNWTIFISKIEKKFVTSDNPVAMFIPERRGFYGPSFLERTHHFALTPEIFIVAKYPVKDSGKKLKRKTLFSGSEGQVLNLNLSIYDTAHQYVYASDQHIVDDLSKEVERLLGAG